MNAGGQQGLNQVVQFFNVRASGVDLTSAIGVTDVLMTIAILVVSILGFIALAIWVTRIGVDILLITLRGTEIANKMSKLGTSQDTSAYNKVSDYLKKNFVEIILVVVFIGLMITGWLWRIFAIALNGFGAMLNFLLGLDVDGLISGADAEAWKKNIENQTYPAIRDEYEQNVAAAQGYLGELYNMVDVSNDDPRKLAVRRKYSVALAKANVIGSNSAVTTAMTTELKLYDGFFDRHKKTDLCRSNFFETQSMASFGSFTCSAT